MKREKWQFRVNDSILSQKCGITFLGARRNSKGAWIGGKNLPDHVRQFFYLDPTGKYMPDYKSVGQLVEETSEVVWQKSARHEPGRKGVVTIDQPPKPYVENAYKPSERLLAYLANVERRVDKLIKDIKPQTIAELFEYAPEGDFVCKGQELDVEWQPYFCSDKDCWSWHKSAPAMDSGRRNGKRFVELLTCDTDGNWDCDAAWDEGEPEDSIAEELKYHTSEYHILSWIRYYCDCVRTGKDPLDNFTNKSAREMQTNALTSIKRDLALIEGGRRRTNGQG